ncbi:hypothetical protein HSBAA_09180 [Vreelandella sulfidaeris]|uniref:Serine acetyltransferase n=1 Tax=Vreelandella sulfidaeris TaxID=115553 RepID=A0A455U0Y9_9GAMM|nr:hypothetical protein HSBAA_09180 [Halomonas sulfidaeris]
MFQRLREDINSVFDRDPAARNFLEVLTNYPGLHALPAASLRPLALEEKSQVVSADPVDVFTLADRH